MARIRTVKPEFFQSRTLARVGHHARLTFIGLWTYADDEGRAVDDTRLIKAALWPLDDAVTFDHIGALLAELAERRLIIRYAVDGEHYLAVRNWREHQKIDRPRPSKLPAPPEERAKPPRRPRVRATTARGTVVESSTNVRRTVDDASLLEGKGKEGKGTEGSGREAPTATTTPAGDVAAGIALLERFPLTGASRGVVAEFFETIPDDQRAGWRYIVAGCFDGMGLAGMQKAPPEAIAAACADMLGKSPRPPLEPRLFRRYVDDAIRSGSRPVYRDGAPAALPRADSNSNGQAAAPDVDAGGVFDKILTMGESLPGGISYSLSAIEERFGPAAKAAVKAIGGSNALANMRGPDQRFLRDKFVKEFAARSAAASAA